MMSVSIIMQYIQVKDEFIFYNSNLASSGNAVKYFISPNYPENYPNNHSEVIIPPLVISDHFVFTKFVEGMEVGS